MIAVINGAHASRSMPKNSHSDKSWRCRDLASVVQRAKERKLEHDVCQLPDDGDDVDSELYVIQKNRKSTRSTAKL